MQICIFCRPFYPAIGGLEQIAMTIAHESAMSGHEVKVVTDTPYDGVSEFPFAITRTTSNWERFQAFRRADVVLLMNVSLYAIPLLLLAGVPAVLSHQGVYGTRAFGWRVYCKEWLKRNVTRFFPNIACSNFVASHLPTPSVVIPNAYDNALFCSDANVTKSRDFVFCGRLVSDKGAAIALTAFAAVLLDFPHARFTVVGSGPEQQTLELLVERLGCRHQVLFTGFLRGIDLRDALQSHRCIVVPSIWEEPFGIVALEGLACCGRAIVSRRGGLPEAVGSCGAIVEPTAEDLAAAMRLELRRPPSEALALADHLSVHRAQVVAARYIAVLEGAVVR